MSYPTVPSDAYDAAGAFVIGGGDFSFGQGYTESIIKSLFKPPIPTAGTALDLLRQQLLKLPLDALKVFKDLIPDALDADFDTVLSSVTKIMDSLSDSPVFMTFSQFETWLAGLPALLDGAAADAQQAIRDALTGIVNATPTDLDNWLLDLLTGASDLDASKLINLTNIGAIAQAKITGLSTDLTNLATTIGLRLPTSTWQGFLDGVKGSGGGTTTDVFNKLLHLDSSGQFDAAQLGNVTNIPAIAQSKITGLTTALSGLLPTSTWQGFLDTVKGSGGGSVSDVTNRLANINSSGVITLAGIPTGIPQARISGLTSALSGLLSTSTWQSFLDGVKGSGGGVIADVTNKLQKLSSGGVIDITGVPNLSTSKITSGTFADGFLPTLGDVRDGIVNSLAGLGLTGVAQSDVNSRMADVAATLAYTSSAVQQLQSQQSGAGNSGLNTYDQFERTSATDLGGSSYFSQTYTGSGTSVLAIANGHDAAWTSTSTATRLCRCRRTASADARTLTDYQAIWITLGTQLSDTNINVTGEQSLRIYGRMNTGETQYVYAKLERTQISLWYANGGSDTQLGSTVSISSLGSAGQVWGLRCGTGGGLRVFEIVSGSAVQLTYTDSGAVTAAGASNRGWGFGGSVGRDTFTNVTVRPPSLSSVNVFDNTPATVVGSGARMVRTNTAAGPSIANGQSILGTGYYSSTVPYVTPDITADTTNSRFTVTNAGWYKITISHLVNTFPTGGARIAIALYVQGALVQVGADHMHAIYNSSSFNSNPRWIHSDFTQYLRAGDTVTPGFDTTSGGFVMTGDTGGTKTYFDIALMNRSLL